MQDPASFDLSGKGFADATRIAGGDGGLWRDILIDNRENVLASLERLGVQLQMLEKLLRAADSEGIRNWLDDAASRRAKLNGHT